LRGLRGTGDVGPGLTLSLLHRRGLLGLLLRVAALEPLDPPARVDQLLLARVERVAVRADLHAQLGPGAPGRERVPAGTVHGRDYVVGMDALFHVRCLSFVFRCFDGPHRPRPAAPAYEAGAFAISRRNCSLDLVARILSVSSSSAAGRSSAWSTRGRGQDKASVSV